MVNPNRFYTYAYLREDRTPYYIGKGQGNRIYSSNRTINKPKDKSRIIFLKQNLTEEEAFKHEKYMISVFGRKDLGTGTLHNRTNGGDGISGYRHGEDSRKKIRKNAIGRKVTGETRKKMSESKKGIVPWCTGKKLTEEHREKIKRAHKNRKYKKHTEETKKKISEANKGKYTGQKNPMYGKLHTEETKNKMSLKAKNISKDKNSCLYEFLSPTGEKIIEYTTIRDFASRHNLRADCLGKIILGKRKYHKGWTAKKL